MAKKREYAVNESSLNLTKEERDRALLAGEIPITRHGLKCFIRKKEDVTKVDTSHITDFSLLFYFNEDFNQDISGWDVSNGINFWGMFSYARHFNQNISNWDMSNAINVGQMFLRAERFNQDLDKWNLEKVQGTDDFLYRAIGFFGKLPKALEGLHLRELKREFVPYEEIKSVPRTPLRRYPLHSELLYLAYQDNGAFSKHIPLKTAEEIVLLSDYYIVFHTKEMKKYLGIISHELFKDLVLQGIVETDNK